jgi:predicted dehydrogenase
MAAKGKRIGFVDYEADNWHSNVYLAAFRKELKSRGFTVTGSTAVKEKSGRKWAAANDVPYFDDAEEMDERVDYYIVLAPSNPEVHLDLCRRVFPYGKPTYVDKTFAPDLETARKIFALASKHHVPMETTSALRYTAVQEYACEAGRRNVRHMVAWGGGRSFEEYAVHPVEMVVSTMGPGVRSLMRRGVGKYSQLLLDFTGGRTAVVNVYVKADTGFAASITTRKKTVHIPVDTSRIFIDAASAILDLFETGRPSIDRHETLAVMKILDAARNPRALKTFVRL